MQKYNLQGIQIRSSRRNKNWNQFDFAEKKYIHSSSTAYPEPSSGGSGQWPSCRVSWPWQWLDWKLLPAKWPPCLQQSLPKVLDRWWEGWPSGESRVNRLVQWTHHCTALHLLISNPCLPHLYLKGAEQSMVKVWWLGQLLEVAPGVLVHCCGSAWHGWVCWRLAKISQSKGRQGSPVCYSRDFK